MLIEVMMTAALAAAAPSAAAPQGGSPTIARQDPAQAAAFRARAEQLLGLLADGDPQAIDAFLDAHLLTPAIPDMEPAAATRTRLKALARQSGGVDVAEWHPMPDAIFFEGVTRKGQLPVEGALFFKGDKLAGIDLQRNRLKRPADAPAWPLKAMSVDEALKAIRAEIDWRARNELFSGTVLIAHRGTPVLTGSWGLAARGPDLPNRDDTLYHTASATKMLVSAAIATLIDDGKLALDTPVGQAVPGLASAPEAGKVTIGDLLGHRVSYGEYFEDLDRAPELRKADRASDLLPLLAKRSPRRAPPGRIAYSNANYLVLAAAIEAASGRPFRDYVSERVMKPLGLKRTTYGEIGGRPAGAAIGWVKDSLTDPLGLEAFRPNDFMFKASYRGGPAGGAWASAGDMFALIDGIAAGKLVKPATLQAMLADRRRQGPTLGSALGFMFRGGDKLAFFGHAGGGGNAGMSASAFIAPDREWAVVVLSNFSSPSGEMLAGQLLDYLAKLPRESSPSSR